MFGNGAALASARYMYVVWLAVVRRTTLIGTIFRYSLSWIDGPSLERQNFFNPARAPADLCSEYGRSCWRA